jgi:hypothetical protein
MTPKIILILSFSLFSLSLFAEKELPVIPVNIIIATEHPEAQEFLQQENLEWIIHTLNSDFKGHDGSYLVRFQLNRVFTPKDLKRKYSKLLNESDPKKIIQKHMHSYRGSEIIPKNIFPIIIYHTPKHFARSRGGWHSRTKTRYRGRKKDNTWREVIKTVYYYPKVVLHWRVLSRKISKIVLHEAGHTLSLPHVQRISDVTPENNIMAGTRNDPSLPDKNVGYYFTESQLKIMREKLKLMLKTFERTGNSMAAKDINTASSQKIQTKSIKGEEHSPKRKGPRDSTRRKGLRKDINRAFKGME